MIGWLRSRKLREPMPSTQEIADMIPRLGRGARLNLKLVDGGEVLGTLYGLFDGQVYFEEEEIGPIALDRIEDLLVRVHSEQPGGSGG